MYKNIVKNIAKIQDFPKKGILFYDISPILADSKLWNETLDAMAETAKKYNPTKLVALEARGFIFAAALALKLDIGFVMARKPNKLPGETISATYKLEYGSDTLEIQKNSLTKDDRVIIIDDVVATGGTICAAYEIIKSSQAKILSALTLIEIVDLNARSLLPDLTIDSVLKF